MWPFPYKQTFEHLGIYIRMRINLFIFFLSFIGDVFSQRGPIMLFRGIPGPVRAGPFPSGFGGVPVMQPGFLGLPGAQPGFQVPIMQRGGPIGGFQMGPSDSMVAGAPFPGIPPPQFNVAATPFGFPGGTMPDTSNRQAPTVPQFQQGDSFPMIPAQNSESNSAPSSPSMGLSGTIIIPQQQQGLSAQPPGIPSSEFGPSSTTFGQQDQFQGIIPATNGQFQQGMAGSPSQSQTTIVGPSISDSFITRFQPLPQNVENFRQQLQTGRAGTGFDTAFPMVPSETSAFRVQFQSNEPVRTIPAESSQDANRVVQGSNTSTNTPTGQAFFPVPWKNVQIGLQPSVPIQTPGLTAPKSLPAERFRATADVATAPVASPLDVNNRIPDMPQAALSHNFRNLLSSPTDFSFFADQSRKDLKTNTNLVDSQSIDPNQRVIFSMDSKGPSVRLQQVDLASKSTVDGLGTNHFLASTPKDGNNTQSFSFTVSGNSNRVKVEPPAPPSFDSMVHSQIVNTPGKPEGTVAGGHHNPSAAPNAA